MTQDGGLSDRAIRAGEVAFALVVAVLAVALFLATPWLISNWRDDTPFQLSPGFYPRLALGVAGLGALAHIVHIRRGGHHVEALDEFEVGESRPSLMLAGVALFVGYGLLTPWLGYAATTFLFCVAALWLAGVATKASILFATATTGVLFGLFVLLLKVWFPAPALLRWIGLA